MSQFVNLKACIHMNMISAYFYAKKLQQSAESKTSISAHESTTALDCNCYLCLFLVKHML